MLRIATHNSGTGEKGTFWSSLVKIFSKTQSKTLTQQWHSGCRYFDIRLKLKKGNWRLAHGLWTSKQNALYYLIDLAILADTDKEFPTYCFVTYEGKLRANLEQEFIDYAKFIDKLSLNLLVTSVDAKYSGTKKNPFIVDYRRLVTLNKCPIPSERAFFPLDGKNWQTYLCPIPWIWDKVYFKYHEFNEERFRFTDFL